MDFPSTSSASGADAAISESIGKHVRELRERAALSITRLAAACGISQPYLSQIEKGAASPSMSTLYRLAGALGVRPGELLPPITEEHDVILVRDGEGELLPVSDHPDTSHSRTLLFDQDLPLQVFEYVMRPEEYVGDWFAPAGVRGIYVVSGRLQVEVAERGTYTLAARDFLALTNNVSDRWKIVGDEPVHVIFAAVLSAAAPKGTVHRTTTAVVKSPTR